MSALDKEPRDPLSRYAFGYSDEKPGWGFWVLVGLMTAWVVYKLVSVGHA